MNRSNYTGLTYGVVSIETGRAFSIYARLSTPGQPLRVNRPLKPLSLRINLWTASEISVAEMVVIDSLWCSRVVEFSSICSPITQLKETCYACTVYVG